MQKEKSVRKQPFILVTNDDGINAPGILALTEAVEPLGEVYVVAPDREMSAAGHSITLDRPLRVNHLSERRVAIEGTPTDCVLLAILKVMPQRPDLIISGINRGPNMGDDVTYSGTVAAALEGTLLGIPSIAMSLAAHSDCDFGPAAEFAAKLVRFVLKHPLPSDTLLNVNVPNLPKGNLKKVEITRQGRRLYEDEIIEKVDPRGRNYYWIGGGKPHWRIEPGTDFHAVQNGMISVTPIHLDLTNHEALKILRRWRLKF